MNDGSPPRTIYLMWLQGFDKAPPVVRACRDAWRRLHPDWQVVELDETNLAGHVDTGWVERRAQLSGATPPGRVTISDLARLDLMAERGGVWVDATLLPTRPLDDWLPPLMDAGFFAFRRPGPDRLLSNWFLAARPADPLATAMRDAAIDYWTTYPFIRQHHVGARAVSGAVTLALRGNPDIARLLVHPRMARMLDRHPYYWFHYLFAAVLHDDPALARRWAAVPDVPAAGPHVVQREGLDAPVTDRVRRLLDVGTVPVHKLSHRIDRVPGSNLDHLLRQADQPADTDH